MGLLSNLPQEFCGFGIPSRIEPEERAIALNDPEIFCFRVWSAVADLVSAIDIDGGLGIVRVDIALLVGETGGVHQIAGPCFGEDATRCQQSENGNPGCHRKSGAHTSMIREEWLRRNGMGHNGSRITGRFCNNARS